MADLRTRRVLAVVPVLLYLLLILIFGVNGQARPWHEQCVHFWKDHKWNEITALAENLYTVNRSDPDSLFFGLQASLELGAPNQADRFADRLLRQPFLNLQIETETARYYRPDSPRDILRLYRSRITLLLCALLTLLNILTIKKRGSALWVVSLCIIGCVILFV